MVISSITLLGLTHKNGNIFLINLAVADLLVSKTCFIDLFFGCKILELIFFEKLIKNL